METTSTQIQHAEDPKKNSRRLKRLSFISKLLTILLILIGGAVAFQLVTKQFETPRTYYDYQIQMWNQTLAKNPKNLMVRTRIAQLHIKMGQMDKAKSELNAIAESSSTYAPSYYYLGFIYQKQKRLKEAEKNYVKAVSLIKEKAAAAVPAYRLAALYDDQGKDDLAIKYYEMAASGEPLFWNPHFKLGALYEKKGDLKQALGHYEEASKFNPDKKLHQKVDQLKKRLGI